jgi:hypothetical protein
VPGRQQKLYGWPAVPDCVREPQAIHASGKVDVRKYNPDIVSSFEQSDCFIGTAGLKRVEPCFLQKGHCMHSQQELIFDNKNQWERHGNNGMPVSFAQQERPEGGAIKANVASPYSFRSGQDWVDKLFVRENANWSSLGFAVLGGPPISRPRAAPHRSLSFFCGRCPALGVCPPRDLVNRTAPFLVRPLDGSENELLGLGRPEARSHSGRCVRWAWPRFNFLPWAGVAGQHPHMAKKSAPKKATPVKLTAAMKRAGAQAIEGTPELYPEKLAERIYRAMAAAQKR